MTASTPLNEIALAQECLQRLGDEDSMLRQAEDVLELIAHSSVGLGEVLQDFAQQTLSQLHDLWVAARNISGGMATQNDRQTLANAYCIVNTARLVLERTPVAMQRNMAPSIGSETKLSRCEVQKTLHQFVASPDVARLLGADDSGEELLNLVAPDEAFMAPDKASLFLEASAPY